jgi:CRISPR-associated protein Cas6
MYWEETTEQEAPRVPTDVVDLAFSLRCRSLPVDHAWALADAVREILPWIAGEEGAGVHTIHVAASGNGWIRPERGDDVLYPSRRTKLRLRVPASRVEEAQQLAGKTLDVDGHALEVQGAEVRPLSPLTTIFSRYIVADDAGNEENFIEAVVAALRDLDIRPKKVLCGTQTTLATPDGDIQTRSLMLAELTMEESFRLQQVGLGPRRYMGCGLFIPHKGIREVKDD